MAQTIAVLDFGSQLTQVIARRIRECQVYSKIYHHSTSAAQLRAEGVIGIILSGGPSSVFAKGAPMPDRADSLLAWLRINFKSSQKVACRK